MGYRDIWPVQSPLGSTVSVRSAPMTAASTFLAGEVIMLVAGTGTASTAPKDGTQFILADGLGGVALNGPGLATATAELPASQGWGRLWQHPDTGNAYATGDRIWYAPFLEDTVFITRVVLAAGGAAGIGAAFTGADRGSIFQLTYDASTTPDLGWGIERTAATRGTDYVAEILEVIDSQGRVVSATGTGSFALFRVVGS